MNEAWTIERVLGWATEDFRRRGLDSPRLDAELLLGHVLGVDRIRLILDRARELGATDLAAVRELIQRRRVGEPVAYLRGTREFFGLPFLVDRRVLIPRPDTETLVEVALRRSRHRRLGARALDLCTGSGCVAIALLQQRPTWQLVAVDLDANALALARENALRLGAVPGVQFVAGDLFAPLAGARFDLVVGNPPYIPTGECDLLDPGIRDFEPRLALDGGADGLSVLARIVDEAPAHLVPGGLLALETGCDQGDAVAAHFERAGFCAVRRDRDAAGLERVVSGRYGRE
jgi:release factor glutamine methyltransferase